MSIGHIVGIALPKSKPYFPRPHRPKHIDVTSVKKPPQPCRPRASSPDLGQNGRWDDDWVPKIQRPPNQGHQILVATLNGDQRAGVEDDASREARISSLIAHSSFSSLTGPCSASASSSASLRA